MRPSIGIIGGAGPMAGSFFFEKIIRIAQEKYGCSRDGDFPLLVLWSYPFEEMLLSRVAEEKIRGQLADCLQSLVDNRLKMGVIACNTLHAFLPKIPPGLRLIHLIEEAHLVIRRRAKKPLVLCSARTAGARLYEGVYPDSRLQREVSRWIDRILEGDELRAISQEMAERLNRVEADSLVLGCTELSLLNEKAPLLSNGLDNRFFLCDPLVIAAEKICNCYFGDRP